MAENAVFRLYSMTKVIVCAAAMILFERGKFLLSDPLYEYFPEYKDIRRIQSNPNGNMSIVPVKNPMLVRNTFSMSVGLPYPMGESDTSKAMRQVQEGLREKQGKYDLRTKSGLSQTFPSHSRPGTHWLYGYGHELVAALSKSPPACVSVNFCKKRFLIRSG